jgi:hypothetical protein
MKIMLTLLALVGICGVANAGIEWTWVNAGTGTEQGTLITDGELVAQAAPAGTYTILDFSVTATAYGIPLGSMSAGDYFTNQPDIGFDWDGAAPTMFWRLFGIYTNGINLFVTTPSPGGPDRVCMEIDYFVLDYDENVTFLEEYRTPIVTPVQTVTPNEFATFGAVKTLYR